MSKSTSFYSISSRVKSLTKFEILWIILLSLLMGTFSSTIIGIPLIFQEPKLLCSNKGTNIYYKCLEDFACENFENLNIIIDPLSPKSLSAQFNLICERKNIQRFSIFIILSGGLIGALINILVKISRVHKKIFIALTGIFLLAIPSILTLVFNNNIYFISLCICANNIGYLCFYGYYLSITQELFKENIAGLVITFIGFTYGIFGILFVCIGFFIQNDWRGIMFINFIGGITSGVFILILPVTEKCQKIYKNEVNSY